ncbi:hypothetical protein LWI28_017734 [Acer negundo]|uniref:Uncharacterized protein n=1 Tax=Acer negundo TaxID=4023 RepID=A0AAD5IEM5_ACENE|nr:hypothetical protein LWI28_017734 [Acer negundo]
MGAFQVLPMEAMAWWTYWRIPDYNLVRFCFTFVAALVLGTIFWQESTIARLYSQPVVALERTIFCLERAAGMYSAIALPYALAQEYLSLDNELIEQDIDLGLASIISWG